MARFGFLNIHKVSGISSRRVVDQVQRLFAPDKVGHVGTLDPLATGVLVLGIGQATRLTEYLHELPKTYRATFLLGRASDTLDTDGEVIELADAPRPTREQLEPGVQLLRGPIQQTPPAFSALKVAGKRAYALARRGQEVALAPRKVVIHQLAITRYAYPEIHINVECSSGTYIRALGRDLAESAGTSAVMSALVRTAIGPFTIENALGPDQLQLPFIEEALLPATMAIESLMPSRIVSEEDMRRIANGLPISVGAPREETRYAALDVCGRLAAILVRRSEQEFAPKRFFPVR